MPAEKEFVNWGVDKKYWIRIMGTGEWDLATGLWDTEYEVRSVLRGEPGLWDQLEYGIRSI